ncbi:MFS transporter [Streptomyces sp. NPDC006283]|uniref:MFS transporter n=1 Tax=Streptomyces sp. NPDC006283 TaxID=3156741 RepID=UPI0033A88498
MLETEPLDGSRRGPCAGEVVAVTSDYPGGSPTGGARTPEEDEEQSWGQRWQALTVCLIAGFMTLLDVSIVNVALPSIREGLDAPEPVLQWVLSGYALAFGLLLIPGGRLGDAWGRRTVFMLGLALFTVASAACGAAQSGTWLVVARVLQGFAGGLLSPQISALIQQMFAGSERGRAFGMFGTVVAISTAVGPLIGGFLIHLAGAQDGWRWVFYVNLPIGAVCLVLARRFLPDTPSAARLTLRRLDPLGVLLLGCGVLALLLPLAQAEQWHGPEKWLLVVLALILLAYFVGWERYWQRRGEEPVLDLSLFRVRSYWLGCLLVLFYFAGFTSIFFVSTLYLQSGLHFSALMAGAAITPFAAGAGLSSHVGGRLVSRFGRPLITVGLTMVAVGLAGTAVAVRLVPGPGVAWAMAAPLLLAGLGSGLVISPNQTLTLNRVPVGSAGSAAGTLQTGQRVGSAVGISAVGSVFFSQLGRGDWARAYDAGLFVSVAFVAVALLISLTDVIGSRRRRHASSAGTSGVAGLTWRWGRQG